MTPPPILVTGGTGMLGRHLVPRLRATGREIRVLSRHSHDPEPGVEYVTGDLVTGDGVDAAVAGIETIIHCAGTQKGDAEKTQHLVEAARAAGKPHLVFISVVGAERVPVVGFGRLPFAYFASKRATELVVEASGLPWTTLRATQFHDLAFIVVKALAKLPVAPVPGIRIQPVDADLVAARLVELALGEPAGLVADLGGPRAYRLVELFRSYTEATHKRRWVLPVHLPGKTARAIRAGANLPDGSGRVRGQPGREDVGGVSGREARRRPAGGRDRDTDLVATASDRSVRDLLTSGGA